MIALKIVLSVVGLAFLLFGYLIFFQEKYDLINDFKVDYEAGRKDENYAKRVGLIELIVGIAFLAAGIVLFVVA